MGIWKINGSDLEQYGVFLRKGANDEFMKLPSMKDYLTESNREEDGENVFVTNPRMEGRDVSVSCILVAPSAHSLWRRRDAFFSLLKENGKLDFELVKYNRIYTFYYKGCSSLSRISRINGGRVFITFTLNFREPDPSNVREINYLVTETNPQNIITENGDILTVESIIRQ